MFGRYYVAAKQQEQSRQAFTPGALKRDLDEQLSKLLKAVSELTGEEVDSLHAFAELVQKTFATRAAAERMRQTQKAAKLEAKQQEAKAKVQAMDLNQVVAASVTQSLMQVLPSCGVRVPKKLQESLATAATQSLAADSIKQEVLNNLLGKATPKAAAKPKPKPKPKQKPQAQRKGKGKGKGKAATRKQQTRTKGKGKGKGKNNTKAEGKGKGKSKGKGKGQGKEGKSRLPYGPTGRGKGWQSGN